MCGVVVKKSERIESDDTFDLLNLLLISPNSDLDYIEYDLVS